MQRSIPVILLLTASAVLFTACGGETGSADSDTQTIDVYGLNQLQYVVMEQRDDLTTGQEMSIGGQTYYELEGITTQTGGKIKLTLHTISELPPSAMAHNWVLLALEANAQAVNDSSMSAKENDYISPSMEDQIIAGTGLAGGGESKSVTFTVPEETGEYDYLCTFPGHYSSGMRGTLTVE